MQIYNITEAKANLSKIITDIEKTGEAVMLARNGQPVVEVRVPEAKPSIKNVIGKFKNYKGFYMAPDWKEWDREEAIAFGIIDKDETEES